MVPPLSKWRGRPETAEQHDARVQAQDVVAIRSMTNSKRTAKMTAEISRSQALSPHESRAKRIPSSWRRSSVICVYSREFDQKLKQQISLCRRHSRCNWHMKRLCRAVQCMSGARARIMMTNQVGKTEGHRRTSKNAQKLSTRLTE